MQLVFFLLVRGPIDEDFFGVIEEFEIFDDSLAGSAGDIEAEFLFQSASITTPLLHLIVTRLRSSSPLSVILTFPTSIFTVVILSHPARTERSGNIISNERMSRFMLHT